MSVNPKSPFVKAVLAVALLCVFSSAISQQSLASSFSTDVLVAQTTEAIKARANTLREVKELLTSKDPLIQRAAIEESLQSGDPVIVEMAYDAGLASDDVNIQTTTFGHWLASRERLNLEVTLPDRISQQQKDLISRIKPLWFGMISVTPDGQVGMHFRNIGGASKHVGSLVPGGLVVTSRDCRLELRVQDNTLLSGSYGCGAIKPLAVTGRIQ